MKKINFLFGALAALAMGGAVTACSDDDLDKGIDNGVAEVDQTRYLSVTISNPTGSGSRANEATDFEAGTGLENYVHELFFVFYDALGNPTGEHYQLSFTDNVNNTDGTNNTETGKVDGEFNPGGNDTPGTPNQSVGKVWTSVIPVTLKQGDNLPSYVMAFVNPINSSGLITKTLAQLDETERNLARCTDTHFPMSNSVYYGNNIISGETNARMVATPITTAQLATSKEAAEDAPSVEIYVERYASKVKLTLNNEEGTIVDNEGVNGYKLTFVPEYWRPNAISENTYVVKRYGVIDGETVNYKPTYSDLLGNFNNLTWWNDAPLFRSYWAASPSYYKNAYPSVSDDVTDATATGRPADGYAVHYFTYKEIEESKLATETGNSILSPSIEFGENGFNEAFYARETTTYSGAWKKGEGETKNYNPLATIPSIVIVGRYKVTPTDGGAALADESSFYLYGKTNSKYNLYQTEEEVKKAMATRQNVVLMNIAGEGETPNYQPVRIGEVAAGSAYVAATSFTVKHPSETVRDAANIKVAGRLVALQIPEDNIPTGLFWYNANAAEDENPYQAITTTNVSKVNEALLTAGYATLYGGGRCYFNIPIEHLGIRTNVSGSTGDYVTNAKNADGTYNFNSCPAGSFGLVRNHVYNINVSKISGLATALRDENQPIVPPVDEVEYHIAAKLKVLNWRIVPTQNVIL